MDSIELMYIVGLGLGFWVLVLITLVIIPLRTYLHTGKVWNLTPDRKSFFVFEGKRAMQVLLVRLVFICGCIDYSVSLILLDRIAWEGILVIFVSLVFGFFTTIGVKRVPRAPRKNLFWRR